jgi:hypothetical protein
MVTKPEAELAIRSLCTTWMATLPADQHEPPSFARFKAWLSSEGYSGYLKFRSVMGAGEDSERWFDDELKQNW